MESDSTKRRNEKIIFEQKRERIQNMLEEINLTESAVNYYQKEKKKYGVDLGIAISILAFITFKVEYFNLISTLLVSLGLGFASVSIFNVCKYFNMKKIRSMFSDVDFNNYDFADSIQRRNKLHGEMIEIDNKLLEISKYIDGTVKRSDNDEFLNENIEYPKEQAKVLTKKLGGKR